MYSTRTSLAHKSLINPYDTFIFIRLLISPCSSCIEALDNIQARLQVGTNDSNFSWYSFILKMEHSARNLNTVTQSRLKLVTVTL